MTSPISDELLEGHRLAVLYKLKRPNYPPVKFRKFYLPQPKPYTLMTLNVKNYQDADISEIYEFIEVHQPDILCLQEDNSKMIKKHRKHLSDYQVISYCKAEDASWSAIGGRLANTILVKKTLQDLAEPLYSIKIHGNCPTPRCAASIIFKEKATISNIHLCGGRFDDRNYHALKKAKGKSIQRLIDEYQPEIIVGDLNGESTLKGAKKHLKKHPIFKNLSDDEKEIFLKYHTSAHTKLIKNDYQAPYDDHFGSTSVYGGLPDWIYTKPHIKVTNPQIIPTLHISDHNAVMVTLHL